MTNWDRQYRLKATSKDGASFEIGKPNSQGFALHISFLIQRNDTSTLGTARIQVWNLNKSEIETLMKDGCTITLNAGYGETRPVIFTGTVADIDVRQDGADRVTIINAVDGFAEISSTVVSVSYSKNTTLSKVLADTANRLSLPISYSESAMSILEETWFSDPFSFIGYAKVILDNIAAVTDLSWDIQNGILQIRKDKEYMSACVNLLDKSTGLIGIPKRTYSSAVSMSDEDSASSAVFGYQVEYFLNGAIGVGDKVKIETDNVTGLFRVTDLTIEGDNIEGNWMCTAKVTETNYG